MSGMMTFRVINKDAATLRRELINSPNDREVVEFNAISTEDASLQQDASAFKFRVEEANYTIPVTFAGHDEVSGGWVFITIHEGFDEVEFTLYTP